MPKEEQFKNNDNKNAFLKGYCIIDLIRSASVIKTQISKKATATQ